MSRRAWSAGDDYLLLMLSGSGMSWTALGEQMGRSPSTLRRAARRMGMLDAITAWQRHRRQHKVGGAAAMTAAMLPREEAGTAEARDG